jgi:hypothetical protein
MNRHPCYKKSQPLDISSIFQGKVSGLYYKHNTIVNDDSRVVRMMLQVVAPPTIVILTALEVSIMLLNNIYSIDITHDNRHMVSIIYL